MRSLYLVAYDICDKRRLRFMHKTMLGFGDAIQYSIFRCLLSPREKLMMIDAAKSIMNQNEDRLMIVSLGPEGDPADSRVEFIGIRLEYEDRHAVIV